MVDFTTPNLCGASLDFNKLMSQFDDVKKLLSDNLEAEASALAELLDVDLNVLDVDLRSMVTTLQSIKALNLQSEITSLVGMSAGSSTYVNKLADIAGKFGTGLSAGGYSLDSLVSGAVSDLAAGLDLCANVPNFELPVGATEAEEKAKVALQPTTEPEKETKVSKNFPATVELNPAVSEAKTAAADKVSSYEATPSEEEGKVSGAFKTATKTEEVTYSTGSQKVVTPKNAVTTSVETITTENTSGSISDSTTSQETSTTRTTINESGGEETLRVSEEPNKVKKQEIKQKRKNVAAAPSKKEKGKIADQSGKMKEGWHEPSFKNWKATMPDGKVAGPPKRTVPFDNANYVELKYDPIKITNVRASTGREGRNKWGLPAGYMLPGISPYDDRADAKTRADMASGKWGKQAKVHANTYYKVNGKQVSIYDGDNLLQMGTGIVHIQVSYTYLSNYDPRYKVEE